jgi:hypothetical protein
MYEHMGLGTPDQHSKIPLLVEVQPEDILYAPMPGTGGKWRVRRLQVLDYAWSSDKPPGAEGENND